MHGMIYILLAVLCWPFSLHASTPHSKTLVFEIALKPEPELYRTLTAAFRDFLQKQGYEVRTISLPPKRGLQQLKSGQVDGSIGRMGNLSKPLQADQLIRLDTPISLSQTKSPERPQLNFEISVKPESELGSHLIKAMTEVLDGLGYDFRYTEYPAKRGLIELKEGRIDGTIGRIGNLAELLQSSRVKRIDHPSAVFDFSRWCLKETRPDQPRIRVATRLGALAMMMLEPEMSIPPVDLLDIKDHRSALKMLKSKRLDCIITAEKGFEAEGISANDLKDFVRADLITFEVFPWILDKHESLRQAIAVGLKNYPFTADFRQKYQSSNRVCENSLNRLCPDGILFRKKVDFTIGPR